MTKLSINRARQDMDTFNLKNASREIRLVARNAGIKSGRFEPVNQNRSVDELCETGRGDAAVAIVSNKNKRIVVTADDIKYAYLLDG